MTWQPCLPLMTCCICPGNTQLLIIPTFFTVIFTYNTEMVVHSYSARSHTELIFFRGSALKLALFRILYKMAFLDPPMEVIFNRDPPLNFYNNKLIVRVTLADIGGGRKVLFHCQIQFYEHFGNRHRNLGSFVLLQETLEQNVALRVATSSISDSHTSRIQLKCFQYSFQ